MAIFSSEFAAYLATQMGGSWAYGTNIFEDDLPVPSTSPSIPKTAIGIFSIGGENSEIAFAGFNPYLRVVSRASTKSTAKTNWKAAFDAINRDKNATLTSFHVYYVESIDSEPRLIVSEPKNFIYESRFKIFYRNQT